jgi:hypothetical protein
VLHLEKIGEKTSQRDGQGGKEIPFYRNEMDPNGEQFKKGVRNEVDEQSGSCNTKQRTPHLQMLQDGENQRIEKSQGKGKGQIAAQMGQLRLVDNLNPRQNVIGKKNDQEIEEERLDVIHAQLPYRTSLLGYEKRFSYTTPSFAPKKNSS